jgi:hypothetical protein
MMRDAELIEILGREIAEAECRSVPSETVKRRTGRPRKRYRRFGDPPGKWRFGSDRREYWREWKRARANQNSNDREK